MNRDKGIIRIAGIILIIALVIIYSLVNANRRTSEISQNQQNPLYNTTNTQDTQKSTAIILPYNEPTVSTTQTLYNTNTIDNQINQDNKGIVQGRGITKISNEILLENETTNNTNLPGTATHIGGLASLQTLGIDPVYILKDQQEAIYYIPLDQEHDRNTIASRYNGNIKEIIAQTEIQSNQLWGDKVTYINLPQYAGQLVLMVVETNNQKRLLQINYADYHTNKGHMKQRFN